MFTEKQFERTKCFQLLPLYSKTRAILIPIARFYNMHKNNQNSIRPCAPKIYARMSKCFFCNRRKTQK